MSTPSAGVTSRPVAHTSRSVRWRCLLESSGKAFPRAMQLQTTSRICFGEIRACCAEIRLGRQAPTKIPRELVNINLNMPKRYFNRSERLLA
jgi:hypothetical protein